MNALRFRSTLLVLAVLSAWAASASDGMSKAERDAEEKEMAEEDAALGGTPRNSNFTGKFTQYTDAQIKSSGDPTVVGRFDSSGDESKLVRVTNDKVKAELKKLNGKEIVVNGRPRLNGKYLYAARVLPVGPGNAFIAPAGGL